MPEWTIIFTVVPRVASQWGMCHVAVSHATCASCKPSWDLAGDMKSSLNGTSMLNTTPGIPLLGLVPCVCLLLLLTLELTAAAADSPRSHPGGYSALCVVGKDENLYVREWVEYHKCLGFSKIYMYDHNSTRPLKEEISEYVESSFVQYIDFSAKHRKFSKGYSSSLERFGATIQGQAYLHCTQSFGKEHQFLGFIDFDEFLVIHDPGVTSVNSLLKEYEKYPGLSVYWIHLGSSGHKQRPEGTVVDSYTRCTPDKHKVNTQFKTFANTAFGPTLYSPHRAIFNASADAYMVDENFVRIARGRNKNSTHTRASVYHYVIKSVVDFEGKRTRGGGAGVTRPKYYFSLMDRYSTAVCTGAQENRDRFCKARNERT